MLQSYTARTAKAGELHKNAKTHLQIHRSHTVCNLISGQKTQQGRSGMHIYSMIRIPCPRFGKFHNTV